MSGSICPVHGVNHRTELRSSSAVLQTQLGTTTIALNSAHKGTTTLHGQIGGGTVLVGTVQQGRVSSPAVVECHAHKPCVVHIDKHLAFSEVADRSIAWHCLDKDQKVRIITQRNGSEYKIEGKVRKTHHDRTFSIFLPEPLQEGDSGSRVMVRHHHEWMDAGQIQSLIQACDRHGTIVRATHLSAKDQDVCRDGEIELTRKNSQSPPPPKKGFNSGYKLDHRPTKPDGDGWHVEKGFSAHHIIPIAYMGFIWDYFNMDFPAISDATQHHLLSQAAAEISSKHQLNLQKIENDIRQREPEYRQRFPHDYEKRIRSDIHTACKEANRDFGRARVIKQNQRYSELKKAYIESINGDVLNALRSLCSPPNGADPERTWFMWSLANLFEGPDGKSRSDDVQDGRVAESVRPQSFPAEKWAILQTIGELTNLLLNTSKTDLLNRTPAVCAGELQLKTALIELANQEGITTLHRYTSTDWVQDHREIRLVASGREMG
jgi:hypothetical protein